MVERDGLDTSSRTSSTPFRTFVLHCVTITVFLLLMAKSKTNEPKAPRVVYQPTLEQYERFKRAAQSAGCRSVNQWVSLCLIEATNRIALNRSSEF